MPVHTFSADEEWNAGIEARSDAGYRTLVYSGSLGSGTLSLKTNLEGVTSAVPDSKLSAATLDGNGDAIKQMTFQSSGNVIVVLSGSTNPTATVAVL
jgi:hypothetical protein